jgi:hypothetical protein
MTMDRAHRRRLTVLGCSLLGAAVIATQALPVVASVAGGPTTGTTRGADSFRTGWYPDQTNLTPGLLTGGTFGQLFKTAVNGSVYGQPLLDNNQVLVNTENNFSYGIDPVSGTILWSRQYGSPALASAIGCADLAPNMGITSTPVVDPATNTEYLVDNEYVSGTSGPVAYFMHALNLANNGAEQPGFPVQINGTASNDPSLAFNPLRELQRPGLLLLGGAVYVAFSAHCDQTPWQGWIAGVSEAGHLNTMWTTAASGGASGAGIWMSGGGLVSDGPGEILFATGNGASNGSGPIAGTSPPANLGEAVVRVAVQPDNSLKAVDFFSPYDAQNLDNGDIDFGSGSPVALPDANFGTPTIPHLAVEVGKEGYVYLLNRDSLGGVGKGPSGSDNVVGRFGPNGGVWSSPAVWPGDGGWVYIPTAAGSGSSGGTSGVLDAYHYGLDGTGKPTLNLAGTSSDAFGFGSSAPVVTSSGTTSGSALMWTVWSPDGSGQGSQLRAYDPVPVNGAMNLVWSAPVGTASKFNPPGVGGNRLYVGTRDGNVVGFGAPVTAPVTAPSPTFPATIVGQSSTQTLTITANSAVNVTSLTTTGHFSLGAPSQALPASLAAGSSMTVPVTFSPTAAGLAGGSVAIVTAASGSFPVTLTASGELSGPRLASTTTGISFGGVPPSSQSSSTVGFFNNGSQPLTISKVVNPAAPFSTSGIPAAGSSIGPGAQIVVNVTFAPTTTGSYASTLELDSSGGNVVVSVTGSSTTPSVLQITPLSMDYGNVAIGHTATATFQLSNVGGSNLTITKSKPPVLGPFSATTALPEGTTITSGAKVVESVTFTPNAVATTSDVWLINADDGQTVRTVTFTGNGIIGDPSAGGWTLNGSSKIVGGALQLTQVAPKNQAGSAFAPAPVNTANLSATFTSTIAGVTGGADGLAFVLANAGDAPTSLGYPSTGLGFSGIPGVAVALDTFKGSGEPSSNFVGITNGPLKSSAPAKLGWLATTTKVPTLRGTHVVNVTLVGGILTVKIDGAQVLAKAVTVGPSVRLGFTAGTGTKTDIHSVSNVAITTAASPTTIGDPTAGGWTLNGSSTIVGSALQLTQATGINQAGSAFWPTPVSSGHVSATFTTTIGGGSGADGLTFIVANASDPPTSIGANGGGLGFSGVPGVAVAMDTYQNSVNPSNNFVGVTDGPVTSSAPDLLHWLATSTNVPALRTTHAVKVTLNAGTLTMSIDGTQVLSTPVTVGPSVLVGFSGGSGNQNDTHSVSNVSITAA